MTHDLVARSETRNYSDLFRLDLNWSSPDQDAITLEVDGETYTATNVSSYQGLRVWEIPHLPGAVAEAKLDQLLAKTTTNRIVIFHDEKKQAWRWPSRTTRGAIVSSRPARHVHRTGSNDPKFAAKLDAIYLPDDIVLDANQVLAKVRGAFDVETKNESKRASKLMARMYTALEKAYPAGYDPKKRDHEISVSLARILFLLFGDDTEMWSTELFQDFIKDHTNRDGSDLGPKLNKLFRALDTPPSSRKGQASEVSAFPYVNGGIFEERIVLPDLNEDFRNAVLDAAAVDWSTISPAIFGSMFQSVRDAQTRRKLGEHYTSEENILKTLNPLFLDELRAEHEAALARDTEKKKANALNALWERLAELRYMDPACGCGNFIIVAYRELRAIELDIMLALQDLTGYSQLSFDPTLDLKVTLDHFYGIEVDEWPARIAETAMFLVDRQCDLRLKERFGEAPQRLPIQREAKIVVGNALRLEWAQVCPPGDSVVVAGNPPFLGHKERSTAQGDDLKHVWRTTKVGHLDYVTGWYAKALDYFESLPGRWAFVSTNSVAQGESVPLLFPKIKDRGWHIMFAHRTFAWSSEATGQAAVHCVIVGFTRSLGDRRLFSYDHPKGPPAEHRVPNINPYLVPGVDVVVTPRRQPLHEGLPKIRAGSTPIDWGHLTVELADLAEARSDPIARTYLRRFAGGKELIHDLERWCLWLDGPGGKADSAKSPVLRKRVRKVREVRLHKSDRAATNALADTPHLFGERRQPSGHYLGIPQTFSENRMYATAGRLDQSVIASIKLFTAPDEDGFLFGLISSGMFIAWQKTVGGRLESRPSFSSSLVWNTLPLPVLGSPERAAIIAGGKSVLAARELEPDKSLAQHYTPSQMSPELLAAHVALDDVVDRAFGAKCMCESEEERQEVLFRRYAEMTGAADFSNRMLPPTGGERF
ncbi:class I SAM-dependent DNA methyltransferase [Nocardioides aequoreus]|uniref:class I SAM-dependent DNA methyltransferase n=1 Tax=Nocardioides aequoreus TaxID=397278 RepID=UPI00068B1531|nr:DNA methyltransferase [Nocardioides aequoreus]